MTSSHIVKSLIGQLSDVEHLSWHLMLERVHGLSRLHHCTEVHRMRSNNLVVFFALRLGLRGLHTGSRSVQISGSSHIESAICTLNRLLLGLTLVTHDHVDGCSHLS